MGAGQAAGPGQSGAGEDGAEESLPTRKHTYLPEPSGLVTVYLRNPKPICISLSLCTSDHLRRV